jgi:hypothetical protein
VRQVEGLLAPGERDPVDVLGVDVVDRHRDVQPVQDPADRGARDRGEHRAECLVPGDDPVDGVAQGRDVQWAGQAHRTEDVVERASRVELVDQPEPALGW